MNDYWYDISDNVTVALTSYPLIIAAFIISRHDIVYNSKHIMKEKK